MISLLPTQGISRLDPVSEELVKIPRVREESACPCKSGHSYATCCMPFHYGRAKPETAEQLMRSRYSAYFFRLVDYLVDTTHPDKRERGLKAHFDETIDQVRWFSLAILNASKGGKGDKVGKVEFVAEYVADGIPGTQELHEHSRFRRFKGAWKYLDDKG